MKRLILLFIIFCLLLCTTGCIYSPEDVRLADKSSILRYAKKNFGTAEYVSESAGANMITYTVQDKAFEFQYYIKTYARQYAMDGTTFYYKEVKTSNFELVYAQYLCDTFHFPAGVKAEVSEEGIDDGYFGNIVIPDTMSDEDGIALFKEFIRHIKTTDTRKYFSHTIYVGHGDGKWIGKYSMFEDAYYPVYN